MTPWRITWAGIAVNVVLAATKVAVGVVFHSQTLIADGLHSISDLVTDSAVLVGLRVSSRPADSDHHYGHRRVTTLVTMFVGGALLVTAAWIIYAAVTSYRAPGTRVSGVVPFWIALISIAPKETLFRVTRSVGIEAGDASLVANAWHHRTDAFTSIAAAVGLAGVAFGGPNWAFLDQLTAVVLSAFLLVAAIRFIHGSVSELIDAAPDESITACIEESITGTPGVLGFHALRVRKVGGQLALDVHIQVDPDSTVVEGHDVATDVKGRVLACGCDVIEAIVHVEPADTVPERANRARRPGAP